MEASELSPSRPAQNQLKPRPMKFSDVVNWARRRKDKDDPPPSSYLPKLPVEICFKIIRFTAKLAGATNLDLDDPIRPAYNNEEYEIDADIFRDRESLALVCSAWAAVVSDISAEYLVVYSGEQLERLVKKLEFDQRSKGACFSLRTTRIDFKIRGPYRPRSAARLFRLLPRLMVYTNQNVPDDHPAGYTPHEVLSSLVVNCRQTLQRVDWAGPGEPPRYQDLVVFCNGLPNLKTLRLMAMYSYPTPTDVAPPQLQLGTLTTLSLGAIPVVAYHEGAVTTWDTFLLYLSLSTTQLGALTRFECDLFPRQAIVFFGVHGRKLSSFRTAACFADGQLQSVLAACPNLRILAIVNSDEYVTLPPRHSNLEKLIILPFTDLEVRVPDRTSHHGAILNPLNALLRHLAFMDAPNLKEVRIRDIGYLSDVVVVEEWLLEWREYWNARHIEFVDQYGIPYHCVAKRNPLDLVRH